MKKVIIPLIILTIAAFVVYKFSLPKKIDEPKKEAAFAVSSNDSLTENMGGALQAYYNMKDAFTKDDTVLANKEALAFTDKITRVKMDEIKADTSILQLAAEIRQSLLVETSTVVTTKDIQAKRKSFQVVSDGLFDLLRTIGYNGSKVYQLYCPMAFDNNGAAWLSDSREIVNPYFGKKMLHCGNLRDSVNTLK